MAAVAGAGAGAEFKALHCPLAAVNGTIYALAGRTHTQIHPQAAIASRKRVGRDRERETHAYCSTLLCACMCVGVCVCVCLPGIL